jgi:hypothetical protein
VKRKDATFTFSSEPNSISECKLDDAAFSPCVAEKVHRFGQQFSHLRGALPMPRAPLILSRLPVPGRVEARLISWHVLYSL